MSIAQQPAKTRQFFLRLGASGWADQLVPRGGMGQDFVCLKNQMSAWRIHPDQVTAAFNEPALQS
jgi:hypothetical protein